jgi:hypothetical protein
VSCVDNEEGMGMVYERFPFCKMRDMRCFAANDEWGNGVRGAMMDEAKEVKRKKERKKEGRKC